MPTWASRLSTARMRKGSTRCTVTLLQDQSIEKMHTAFRGLLDEREQVRKTKIEIPMCTSFKPTDIHEVDILSKGILRKKHTSSGTNPPGVSLNRLELKKQMRYFFRAKIFCVLQKHVLGKFLA